MNELEHKILVHLKNYHRGKERAITYKALSVELRINSRLLRECVSNIVTNGEGAIGSNSSTGYFYCIDDEEYQYCHDELIARIKALSKRAKGLRIARTRDINDMAKPKGQQELFKVLEMV
jgi:hypothetical protein